MKYNVIAEHCVKTKDNPDVDQVRTFGPFESRQQAEVCLSNQSALATCQGAKIVQDGPVAPQRYHDCPPDARFPGARIQRIE